MKTIYMIIGENYDWEKSETTYTNLFCVDDYDLVTKAVDFLKGEAPQFVSSIKPPVYKVTREPKSAKIPGISRLDAILIKEENRRIVAENQSRHEDNEKIREEYEEAVSKEKAEWVSKFIEGMKFPKELVTKLTDVQGQYSNFSFEQITLY